MYRTITSFLDITFTPWYKRCVVTLYSDCSLLSNNVSTDTKTSDKDLSRCRNIIISICNQPTMIIGFTHFGSSQSAVQSTNLYDFSSMAINPMVFTKLRRVVRRLPGHSNRTFTRNKLSGFIVNKPSLEALTRTLPWPSYTMHWLRFIFRCPDISELNDRRYYFYVVFGVTQSRNRTHEPQTVKRGQ